MKPQAIKQHYITEFVNSGMSQQEAEETFNRKLDGYIDKNGWCRAYFNYCDVIPHDKRKNSWRPISLRGLETNNNWTRIESEKDLPSSQIPCWFELKDDEQIGYYVPHKMSFAGCDEDYHYSDVKAYSEIKQPPKRIY